MEAKWFSKKVKCPVCEGTFETIKIMSSGIIVEKKDEDFCPYYKGTNPILYSAWVCPHCGYANFEDKFEGISDKDAKKIKEVIKPKWTSRDFSGERTNNIAIEAFKLVLLSAQVRNAKKTEIARICMRIAWLYRYMNDEREKGFLKFALDSYKEGFEKERLPSENLDEITCMYMIGQIYKCLGEPQEAAKWFYKIISAKDPTVIDKGKANYIINIARDQIQSMRDSKVE